MDNQHNEEQFSPTKSLQIIADMIEKVQNDKLRKLAKKRVDFKLALAVFTVLNLMFIAIWYFKWSSILFLAALDTDCFCIYITYSVSGGILGNKFFFRR